MFFIKILRKIRSAILLLLGIEKRIGLDELKDKGLVVGNNFIYDFSSTVIDSSHCWLVEIGNNVTLCSGVYLLAHDASTKKELGYTKIGRVIIEDNAFIGINSIVMPGVTIGCGSIVGSGSVVTHDVPSNCVYAGNPARFICSTEDYYAKQKERLESSPAFDYSYTLRGGITAEKKHEMIEKLSETKGFVV